jgi:hypothetical protein
MLFLNIREFIDEVQMLGVNNSTEKRGIIR